MIDSSGLLAPDVNPGERVYVDGGHSPVQRARRCFVPHFFGGPWGAHKVWGDRTRIRTQNEPKPSQGEVPGGRKTTLEAQLGIPNHPLVVLDGQKWRFCSQF